jgi:16S rRNA processing protein RimM
MDRIKIGKIVGTHALKGELKIRSNSDFSEERFQVGKQIDIQYQNQMVTLEIVSKRIHKGNYLIACKGNQDINLVEKYIGCFVYAEKDEQLLAANEYYVNDVIGTKVYTNKDKYVGEVQDIIFNGRHDVLVVKGPFDKVLIPYVEAFVLEENIEDKKMIVNVIPGMLNED